MFASESEEVIEQAWSEATHNRREVRRRALITVLVFCIAIAGACRKPPAQSPQPPPLTEADLVGKWDGHMTYSQKWIDETHAQHPEGDYSLLVKSTKRREQVIRWTIEFREDRTFVQPINLLGGPEHESVTWSLSTDRTEILVTYIKKRYSPDAPERKHTIRSFRIADGGQTLTALINNGRLPETYGQAYHKQGSDAHKTAFPKNVETQQQWGCPPTFKAEDYFGAWRGHHTMSQEHWEEIRGTRSLVDTNLAKREFEGECTLILKSDMTFDFRTPEASSKGKWHMEASAAMLEWDDRTKPGYQSTRPSPTKMPVDLYLQADGTLIVDKYKYGSTGPIRMTRS
jgi:hypothetical protein